MREKQFRLPVGAVPAASPTGQAAGRAKPRYPHGDRCRSRLAVRRLTFARAMVGKVREHVSVLFAIRRNTTNSATRYAYKPKRRSSAAHRTLLPFRQVRMSLSRPCASGRRPSFPAIAQVTDVLAADAIPVDLHAHRAVARGADRSRRCRARSGCGRRPVRLPGCVIDTSRRFAPGEVRAALRSVPPVGDRRVSAIPGFGGRR